MPDNENCAACPIQELLRTVPQEHRIWFSDDPMSHQHIPVGRICHDAANTIDTLRTRLSALEAAAREVEE